MSVQRIRELETECDRLRNALEIEATRREALEVVLAEAEEAKAPHDWSGTRVIEGGLIALQCLKCGMLNVGEFSRLCPVRWVGE